MKLQSGPFEKIKAGTKTIEIRLNDEKRQLLNVGDQIEFSLLNDSDQKILVEISNLKKFKSFKELCFSFDPQSYGSENREEHELMYKYYTKEDEEKYGVLAIEIAKLY
jgi:ASC-1-like (ASCH) protein